MPGADILIEMCELEDLFVWDFSSHLRIFHSYGDVTIDGEGL